MKGTHLKHYQAKKSLLSKTEIQNKFICLWGWIQDSKKMYRTKKGASRKSAQYHITAIGIEPLLPLLMWSTLSHACLLGGFSALSWQWGSCNHPISLAMPVVAQLLPGSPKPHRSRVRFQVKMTHWSYRLRPRHWVDIPIPLKTSLLRKEN
jgi:hypothetical protein